MNPLAWIALLGALGTPLDARQADRAVVLALQAELVGDDAGARRELSALYDAAKSPAELVAKERLADWLGRQEARTPAWRDGASLDAVVTAWDALEGFGPLVEALAWQHLGARCEALLEPLEGVRLELDRAAGTELGASRQVFVEALRRVDIQRGALALGVGLDASETERKGRWTEAKGRMELVLTTTASPPVTVLRAFRSRTERRAGVEGARAQVVRRLARDAAHRVRFVLRRRALERRWRACRS